MRAGIRTVSIGCASTNVVGYLAPKLPLLRLDYREPTRLRERVKRLRLRGHTTLDEVELADALAQHVTKQFPTGRLQRQLGQAMFLRRSGSSNAKPVRSPEALESLYCHRLPSGLCHLKLSPIAGRLRTQLAAQEAYRPVSPFA